MWGQKTAMNLEVMDLQYSRKSILPLTMYYNKEIIVKSPKITDTFLKSSNVISGVEKYLMLFCLKFAHWFYNTLCQVPLFTGVMER